ncbi:MAG TPA: FkbM family methyltransferase [Hyphomicrobiales bacterium]|nr:FkbM family methyltransferase [Hyphomicrobiales bacterium]
MDAARHREPPTEGPPPFGTYAPGRRLAAVLRRTRGLPDGWIGRRLAYAWRRIGLSRLAEPVDAEALGARFRLYPADNVAEKRLLFTPQYFDAAEREVLVAAARAAGPGFVFIDIGANVGGYSLAVAAAAAPGSRIIAVEPQPDVFERLCDNIRLNPGCMVKAVGSAVTDLDGEVSLFIDRLNRGETGVRYLRAARPGEEAVTVPAKTLVTLLGDEAITHLDAIKLDVEGAEDIILEPFFGEAPETLWPRLIVIEDGRQSWQSDLLGLLLAKGYRRKAETKRNLIFVRG